jgi:hypothetical protein
MRFQNLLRYSFAFIAFITFGLGIASAQESHLGIAVKATTLGWAIEAATPIADRVNVRAGFNFFSLSHTFDTDEDITLDAKLKLRSFNTYLDWFPFGGGFHLSPGLMVHNGIKVDATASVPNNTTFDLGDEKNLTSDPTSPVTGNATISFKTVAPIFVLGWGNLIPRGSRHWAIPFEIGVVYSRAPTGTLNLTGRACAANGTNCRNIATDPQLQADLKKQQDTLNHDLKPLKALPIVSLGFAYKF